MAAKAAALAHRPLAACSPKEQEAALLAKLQLCEVVYDFSDARRDFAAKELKRRCLVEILEYVTGNAAEVRDVVYGPLFRMITANVFRALPVGSSNDAFFDQDDDEPFLEPAWPHLQVVYELLRVFIVSPGTDVKLIRANMSPRFVVTLVDLFNSEDPREREYLKTILHRMYGKIMQPRPLIRRTIMNVFHRFVYETHRHNGIAELLEIIGSIINGFATPLKEEHKLFLRNILIPLHTPKALPSFHTQLSFCVTQFVEKDTSLAHDVIRGLVKYWPVTHSRKEVLLLNELEELLELISPDDLAPVIEVLFGRIARCIESSHFQVAERALFFWNNEYIVSLIVYFRAKIVPAVFGALQRNVEAHWNANVNSLSFNVQKLLAEMDMALYESARMAYLREKEQEKVLRKRRRLCWAQLEGRESSLRSAPSAGADSTLSHAASAACIHAHELTDQPPPEAGVDLTGFVPFTAPGIQNDMIPQPGQQNLQELLALQRQPTATPSPTPSPTPAPDGQADHTEREGHGPGSTPASAADAGTADGGASRTDSGASTGDGNVCTADGHASTGQPVDGAGSPAAGGDESDADPERRAVSMTYSEDRPAAAAAAAPGAPGTAPRTASGSTVESGTDSTPSLRDSGAARALLGGGGGGAAAGSPDAPLDVAALCSSTAVSSVTLPDVGSRAPSPSPSPNATPVLGPACVTGPGGGGIGVGGGDKGGDKGGGGKGGASASACGGGGGGGGGGAEWNSLSDAVHDGVSGWSSMSGWSSASGWSSPESTPPLLGDERAEPAGRPDAARRGAP